MDPLAADRADTLRTIAALTADFEGIVEGTAATDDEHDPEGATIAFERAQVSALLDRARAHLAEVDRAAARLAAGTYGICELCGRPIATERLAALPATATCIACAPTRSSPPR
jgi:RNA polymerase-binding transcription factor DksA